MDNPQQKKPSQLKSVVGNLSSKVKIFIAEQQAKRAQRIAGEKARQERILSGNIQPIETSLNLVGDEKAYFEFKVQRIAENEYVEEITKGKSRKTGVLTRAVVGGVLLGPLGAVAGAATAGSREKTTTTQKRTVRSEVIDEGLMAFTNKRIMFVGNGVVSIPYEDIIEIDFYQQINIKYSGMLTGEAYNTTYYDRYDEADLYFRGITTHLLAK
jgi:hypothetical protein